MKNLICVLLVVFLPLTLASETQHRFKVCVSVSGDDETINSLISSHLKRELRALGDVDVVGFDRDWRYYLSSYYIELETVTGAKSGRLAIASSIDTRVDKLFISDMFPPNLRAVYVGIRPRLTAAYYPRNELQEYCIWLAGHFNDAYLEVSRKFD